MSNKGLTFIIFLLIVLCVATFGAFYLKINPQLALSQKIFGTPSSLSIDTNNPNVNAPFVDSNQESNNTVTNGTDSTQTNRTQDGAAIIMEGNQNETIVSNTSNTISTDTSKEIKTTTTTTVVSGPLTQTLKKGSSGTQVKTLQQFLIDGGYLTGKADGSFGAMTEAAVKKFQTEYKITVDGIVSVKTRDLINELLAE